MKRFTVINESFTCSHCGHFNPKLPGSCRNHCTKCLYSLHVDQNSPGDRQSTCHGLMFPKSITQNAKKGWIIYHQCQKCGKVIPNKAAEDDNFDLLIQLSKSPHEPPGS